MAREIPDEWRPFTEAKGVTSYRALAAKAKIAPATVIRLLNGEGDAEHETVEAVARVLGLEANKVYELHGSGRQDFGPPTWPDEARYLTLRQREAVAEVIRAMANPGAIETVVEANAEVQADATVTQLPKAQKPTRRAARTGDPNLPK